MMRRLGLAIPALLLLLIGAAWVVPRHLDWDDHRGTLAALAADELGRPVALQGAVRVTLLPQPMVEADDVIVGGSAPDDIRLAARGLRLRLDLGIRLALRRGTGKQQGKGTHLGQKQVEALRLKLDAGFQKVG